MPRLTPAEKQDIIRFLEADKPLPDKYRFLLFGDKREVELVWNGKTSEVCNVVLPFQVIEQVDEPRSAARRSWQGELQTKNSKLPGENNCGRTRFPIRDAALSGSLTGRPRTHYAGSDRTVGGPVQANR